MREGEGVSGRQGKAGRHVMRYWIFMTPRICLRERGDKIGDIFDSLDLPKGRGGGGEILDIYDPPDLP